jgi:geranylgeranyl pyrophosphate synthase
MKSDEFKAAIEARLAAWFEQKEQEAPTDESRLLIERMHKLILRAGKRSRPALLHLTYEAYGGTDIELLIDIGVALELHHQFLLVHDDIMDNDTVRYDGPNITGYYQEDYLPKAPEIPPAMALLAGNLLFTFACQAILNHPKLQDDKKVALLKLLEDINIGVHAGQQLDIVNVYSLDPIITEESLLRTNELKTALYSIELPMQTAAILLDLPDTERQAISKMAKLFGVLYQLVDDHSDYFKNTSSFNTHPKYRDFRQGKITYPLLIAFETAGPTAQAFLKKHIGDKQASIETLEEVVDIFEECGAKQASKALIDDYFTQTETALDRLKIDAGARQQFEHAMMRYRV